MAASLLKYDLSLARRSFADAFATRRDRLLLAIVTIFFLLWLHDAAMRGAPPLPPRFALLAVLAAPASFGWNRAVLRRLAWFGEASVIAPEALVARARLSYLGCTQLPLLAVLAFAVLFLSQRTGERIQPAAVALLCYGAGLALTLMVEGRDGRKGSVRRHVPAPGAEAAGGAFRTLLARQTFGARRPVRIAALLAVGTALATLAVCWFAAAEPFAARLAAALLPSALSLVATGRNAPEIVSLLAFAGHPARLVALSVCALPAVNLAAVSMMLFLATPEGWAEMLGGLLLLHLLAALIATERAWLSPGRSARGVDFQVQLEMLGLLIIALLFAPLAFVAAAWRLWLMHRHYSALLWIQT